MKQNLFNKLWLRVGMIVAIMTTALAVSAQNYESVMTFDCASASHNGSQAAYGVSSTSSMSASQIKTFLVAAAGINTISVSNQSGSVYWAKGQGGTGIPDDVLKIGKASGGGSFTVTIPDTYEAIKKVSIKGYGWKTTTAVSVNNSAAQSPSSAATLVTFDYILSTATREIAISVSSSAFCATEIVLYKEAAGGTPTPSISAENVEIAYNATSGSIAYTINNSVEGGAVSAAVTSGDWLTLGTVGATVPFTCTANNSLAARTAAVTLTYTYGSNQTATKNVTVTQAADPNAVNNISDITAAGTYTVKGTIVAKSQRGFIVGDGTGYVYYYNQNYTQSDYSIGDKVKLSGSVVVYGGVFEFDNTTTVTAATESNYVAEEPTVLTGSQMDTRVASTTPAQLSTYVQYEGVLTIDGTHYNITSIDGASTAKGSISYPISTDFTSLSGKTVKVTGYYVGISSSTYYNTMIGSIEEVTNAAPVIGASNVTLAYDATSGEITYTIANPTDATLTATSNASWISNITVGASSVTFTTTANNGTTDREATITLSYTGAEDVTVTVTQGHYVADYATLPFSWEGGASADLLALAGVTANGLGSDYAEGNAPYLVKLDGTGDYIQVKTDSRPGVVTIGVKMIGGATTSTITVQESADGETFDDVQALTISGAQNDVLTLETTNSFATDSRYVRLLFTKGSNVGVGPISIAEYSNAPVLAVSPYTTTVGSEATNGTLNVTATNFSLSDAEHDEFQYFESDGSTASEQPAWLTVSYNGTEGKINYSVTANDGEARSAYFKLVLTYDEEDIYSDIITINQDAYVAPPTPGTEEWVEVALDELTADDVFVIVGDNFDTYAMSNDNGTTSAPAAVAVTVTDNKITSTVADNIKWNIESTTDGYIFYPDGEAETWLYCTNTNNGVRVGTGDAKHFTVDQGYLTTAETTDQRYIGIYNSQDWRCYTSINNNIAGQTFKFYKKVEATPADDVEVNIAIGYSTLYYGDRNLVVPDDVEAYTYKVTNKLEVSKTYEAGDVIPAGTAVVLKAANGSYTFEATTETGEGDEDNALKGSDVEATTTGGNYYYALSLNSSGDLSSVGFYWMTTGGAAFTCGAHKAYLALDNTFAELASGGVKGFIALPDDDATAISTVESFTEEGAIYNVAGQRLQKMQKGINIVNGKKILK